MSSMSMNLNPRSHSSKMLKGFVFSNEPHPLVSKHLLIIIFPGSHLLLHKFIY
ncbi:hypothetical protein HanRHA438_Chr02g0093501 [Helianthus annuus]|nr:hypothetical protein HanRHA438_Chr02g0093501 [Helianthus annuus]